MILLFTPLLAFAQGGATGQTVEEPSKSNAGLSNLGTSALSDIANIATALVLVVTAWQLHSSNVQHKENARREAANQAIEIARHYQGKVIDDMTFVTCAFGLTGQAKRYEDEPSLHRCNLQFTKEEMLTETLGPDAIEEYSKFQNQITSRLLLDAALCCRKVSMGERMQHVDEREQKLRKIVNEKNAINDFEQRVNSLLNTLEWMAMMIITRVADEGIIYQSLHQTFLPFVRMLYPKIAKQNSYGSARDHYYANIMILYNSWQKKFLAAKKKDDANVQRAAAEAEAAKATNEKRRKKNMEFGSKLKN